MCLYLVRPLFEILPIINKSCLEGLKQCSVGMSKYTTAHTDSQKKTNKQFAGFLAVNIDFYCEMFS